MYPDRELIRLAIHKTAVRRRIAVRRALCVEAAGRVTRPVVLLSAGHPRFATHRPAASITTSHAHRF